MAVLNPQAPEFIISCSTPSVATCTYESQPQPQAQPELQPFFPYHPTYYYCCTYHSSCFIQPTVIETYASFSTCCGSNLVHVVPELQLDPQLPTLPPPPSTVQILPYPEDQDPVVDKTVVSEHIAAPTPRKKGKRLFGRRENYEANFYHQKLVWKPKLGNQKSEPKELFESEPVVPQGTKTSVMIRNIPNKISGEQLLKFLEEHCHKMNKEHYVSCKGADAFTSAFDFFYLPIDFESKCNKGYAFVNFTDPRAVWKLYESFHNFKWDILNTKKICEITYARIQGKEALINHFESSTFACDKDEYLPIWFKPCQNGAGEAVEQFTVGKRVAPRKSK